MTENHSNIEITFLLNFEIACLNVTPGFDIIILVMLLTRMGSGVLTTWVPAGTHLISENLGTDGYRIPAR